MTVYTYSEARQKLAKVLDFAKREGKVLLKRKDGTVFVIQPERQKKSPLDVIGIKTNLTASEIVRLVRESRAR